MQARNAARVLPEPVGAEMSVVCPARMWGQPCSCGSVGVPKRWMNHSRTRGCAQSSAGTARGEARRDIIGILNGKAEFRKTFASTDVPQQKIIESGTHTVPRR